MMRLPSTVSKATLRTITDHDLIIVFMSTSQFTGAGDCKITPFMERCIKELKRRMKHDAVLRPTLQSNTSRVSKEFVASSAIRAADCPYGVLDCIRCGVDSLT